MNQILREIMKGLFFYLAVVVLATFFLSTFIEGLKMQLLGKSFEGTLFYFTALLALAAAAWVYSRGRIILARVGVH